MFTADEDTTEAIKEMVGQSKALMQVCNADKELYELAAQNALMSRNAFLAAGFTGEEALLLTCASMKSTK
jgi:hypothetical protein